MAKYKFEIGNKINLGREPWNKSVKTGIAPWQGKKRSEEDKDKMRSAKLGKHLSPKTEFKMGMKPWNKGKVTGVKPWLGKKRLNISGEKSHFWKGGITPINRKIRTSLEYKLWRRAILDRDNHKCIWCGSDKNLQVDHIKPFALFPELRFAIDNGRTLCKNCHETTDTYLNRWYRKDGGL